MEATCQPFGRRTTSHTITEPATVPSRPGLRFGLIDHALAPFTASLAPAAMAQLKLDPKAYLDNNDATAFFAATRDLLQTGPTLTNVNDIRVILVD